MQMIAGELGDDVDLVIFEDSADFLTRAAALEPRPSLFFLDIHVRPHTGFDMLEMLRGSEDFATTPVVAMTASVMNEEIQRLRHAGFNGCIAKPIDMDTFPRSVQRILDGESIWNIIT